MRTGSCWPRYWSRVLHSRALIYRVERVRLCDLYPAPGDEYVSFVLTWPTTGCSQSQVNARQVPLLRKCHSVWKVRLIHGEPCWRLWRKWRVWKWKLKWMLRSSCWIFSRKRWFCRFSFRFLVEIFAFRIQILFKFLHPSSSIRTQ